MEILNFDRSLWSTITQNQELHSWYRCHA